MGGWHTAPAWTAPWGNRVGKDYSGETAQSTSPVLVSATHPNLHCDFEITAPLRVAAAVRQMIMPAFLPFVGRAQPLVKPAGVRVPGLLRPV